MEGARRRKGQTSTNRQDSPRELSTDSGIILAYYLGEKLGALVPTEIFEPEGKSLYHSRVCIAELFYVLCRRRG